MAQKLLTLDEAAARLGISSDALSRLVDQRKIFAIKDAGGWKFKVEEVDRLAAELGESSGDQAYYPDESQDDGGLVTDALLGGAGPGSRTVIGPGGGLGHDSDLTLGGDASDSDVKLVADGDLDSGSGGSGLKLVPNVPPGGSDLHMVDLDSGSDTFKLKDDDATLEAKPGSGLKLGGSSGKLGSGIGFGKSGPKLGGGSDLTISESGLSLGEDDDVIIGGSSSAKGMNSSKLQKGGKPSGKKSDNQFDDDDIVLGGSSAGLGSGIGDSGINLAAAADSGLSLEEPLELSADDGESSGDVDMASDDDFLLTPMLELDDQDSSDSSGSQVIALDSEGVVDDQSATILGSDTPTLSAMGPSQAMGPGPMMVPMQSVAQPQHSAFTIIFLVASFLVLSLTGMMLFELARNGLHWEGVSATSTTIIDGLVGLLE